MSETMTVTRVTTGTGSHIEPPLDDRWDDLTKLRWQAAVVSADTGAVVRVQPAHMSVRRWGTWRRVRGVYDVLTANRSIGAGGFRETWTLLNGIAVGAALPAREGS